MAKADLWLAASQEIAARPSTRPLIGSCSTSMRNKP